MSLLREIWQALTQIEYDYTNALDRHRADGIMKMAVGSVIAVWFGLFFAFLDPVSADSAFLSIGGLHANNVQTGYLLICVFGVIQWRLVSRSIQSGNVSQAGLLYVSFLFLVAGLAYIPSDMTNATALVLSMPITGSAVILTGRGFFRTVLAVVCLLIILYVLNEMDLMTEISNSGMSTLDTLIFGSIILVLNGVMLNMFLSGRNIVYQSNATLASEMETLLKDELTNKAGLEQAINDYMSFANSVAEGDLTVRLDLEDRQLDTDLHQLGLSLNAMVKNLTDMTQRGHDVAGQLRAASEEILSVASEQSASVVEQDAAITETMVTVEQVQRTVEETAERVQTVAGMSQQSLEVSRKGQQAVVNTIDGMETVQDRVQDIAETILTLSERTQKISEIIETVNQIADQSRLLALNASIEAARAGDEGRGFAVVAMEVRQLAEQSGEATERVRDILNEIQQVTNEAVMVTEEGIKGASDGVDLVSIAGDTIEALATAIEESAQEATIIAASTRQQATGIEQLLQAMHAIKQASAHSAVSTRQSEESALYIAEMARQMEETVAVYQLM